MSNPSVTNVDGSNPGPNTVSLPDTVQLPTGNVWKLASFTVSLSPTSFSITINEQTFAALGIGLLTTDVVFINKPTTTLNVGIVNVRVSAADTLAIAFLNGTPLVTVTPTQAETYNIGVLRIQPNWVPPASGNQIDW